jgi:DNA-binding SARP family transcriptional activator
MPNASAPTIKLFVLGDARIETDRATIEPSSEIVFAAALHLLLEYEKPVSRRSLEQLLWPGQSRAVASHRMRQTLLKLRQSGIPVETVGKTKLSVSKSSTVIDFEDLMRGPRQIEGLPRCHFVVLPGYNPGVSEPFQDWVDDKRRGIGSLLMQSVLPVLSRHRSRGNWEAVETWSNTLLQLTPYNEEATLALAESHAMRGSKLEGVRILDRYLSEIGDSVADLKLPATVMRKRITDRMPPRSHPNVADTRLVGREDVIGLLSEMLPLVRSGHGQSCLVYGDAGIGKSRLFAEFANFASIQGLACVRVQCRSNDSLRPLSVFVDLVAVLRGMRGAIGCSPETMKHIERLTTHRNVNSSPFSLQGDAEFAYAGVQQAVFDLIDAVAEEAALLILVEDIQRVDEVSKALLSDLLPWTNSRRILLAFTGRDKSSLSVETLGGNFKRIKLEPLDHQSARQLVTESVRQHGGAISEDYLSWCVRVAEGNPYFLTELASHWIQTGETQGAPPSLTAVIDERLAMLETPSMHLLQTCALLEKNATIERIEKILGYPQHQLLQCINELASIGMIVLEQTDAGLETNARLAPRHELLANAAENSLTAPAKAFLHQRIGVVLESEKEDHNSSAILWDCAKHWRQAGNFGQAFAVARSCATHLMDLGLCSQAAEAYEKTFPFCTSDTQRLDVLRGQAHAFFRASDWEKLSTTASNIRDFQRHLDVERQVHDDVELMDIRAQWQRGGQKGMLEKTLSCLTCETANLDHRCRAGIMALMLLDLACDLEGMADTYRILSPLIHDDRADPSHRFEAGMVFETVSGDLTSVLPLAQMLVTSRRRSESIADLMRALANAATAARTAGHLVEARTWLAEAIFVAESHKLPLAT